MVTLRAFFLYFWFEGVKVGSPSPKSFCPHSALQNLQLKKNKVGGNVYPSGDNNAKYLLFSKVVKFVTKWLVKCQKQKRVIQSLTRTRPPIELIHVFVTQSHDL